MRLTNNDDIFYLVENKGGETPFYTFYANMKAGASSLSEHDWMVETAVVRRPYVAPCCQVGHRLDNAAF